LKLFARSLALKEQAGDLRGQGVTLHAMGATQRERDPAEALKLFARSLLIDEQAGDLRGQSITLHEMGTMRVGFDNEAARTAFERGLVAAQQARDPEAVNYLSADLEALSPDGPPPMGTGARSDPPTGRRRRPRRTKPT
ncbi:MAG: hypothetical protein WEB00_11600, partial [Dehalococcoidia bacterium]